MSSWSKPLDFKPRKGIYEAANVWFDPVKCEARSYDWWIFVKKIKGRVVFNTFPYSNTTRRHQARVRATLQALGIVIDEEVMSKSSL